MQDKLITQGINSKGFGTIPKILMQDKRIHVTAKAIYAYFCSYAGGGETAFPSRDKICDDLNIAIDTLSKYLKQLVAYNYIKIEQQKDKGKFSHNVYTLLSEITVSGNSVHGDSVYGNLDRNINNININNINTNTLNSEKKEKEINKENFSRSGTTGNTELSASLKEVERITPTPIRDICLLHIQNFTTDTEIQNLLIDYLDSRLQQTNNNLTEVSFKAALGTLSVAQQYCEVPNLLKNYTKEVILNATAGAYSQFKSIQTNRYKKSYYNSETQRRIKSAPFGDVSNYDPADSDLELATDETGNPIKF